MKLALIAAVLASVAIWAPSREHGPIETQQTATANQKKAQTDSDTVTALLSIETALERIKEVEARTNANEAANTQNAKQQIHDERRLVRYTWWLALFALLQTIVFAATAIVIRSHVRAVYNTEKAWMVVESVPCNLEAASTGKIRFLIFEATNCGNTLATVREWSAHLHTIPTNETLPPVPSYAFNKEDHFVPAGKPFRIPVLFRNQSGEYSGFTEEDVIAIRNSSKTLYLYGCIGYEDAAGRLWYYRYCFKFRTQSRVLEGADEFGKERFVMDGPSAYNGHGKKRPRGSG